MSSYLKELDVKLGRTKRMLALQAPEKSANNIAEDFSASERWVLNAINYNHYDNFYHFKF